MAYFRNFPKIKYDFNRDGVINNVIDIFRQVRPLQNFVDEFSSYQYINIPDGQRPDILSQKLYDTPDFYWTFFIINDFLHDGIGVWPMSMEDLNEYIAKEYEGYALETRPDVVRNTDGQITEFKDSLAGRFTVGETITGSTSGAQGTLMRKDIYLNQLIVQNVTGAYLGAGDNNTLENVSGNRLDEFGNITIDTVKCFKAWKLADAPHHWYAPGDSRDDKITNPDQSTSYGIESQVSNANFFSVPDDAALALQIQEGSTAAAQYVSNRQYVFDLNEQRSRIRVIDPNLITRFSDAFQELVNS